VQGPEDFQWPVSYRYHTLASYGRTQQELTVDIPALLDQSGPTQQFGLELWKRVVAPATVRSAQLLYWETVVWKGLPIPGVAPAVNVFGLLDGASASRDDQAVTVLHSGHADDLGRRRFFLPAIPAAWVAGGLLTRGGLDAIETWGRMAYVGLARHVTAAPALWLMRYPDLLPAGPGNVTGVAFRRVEYLRCCWHTERAPDQSSEPWP
jgi:hypothetical protein